MAAIPKILKEEVEAALGFEIVSFVQNSAIETDTYIQYDVKVVPVKATTAMAIVGHNYIIQKNKDGGETV